MAFLSVPLWGLGLDSRPEQMEKKQNTARKQAGGKSDWGNGPWNCRGIHRVDGWLSDSGVDGLDGCKGGRIYYLYYKKELDFLAII